MKYRKWIGMLCMALMLCACTTKQPEKKKTTTQSTVKKEETTIPQPALNTEEVGSLTVVSNFPITKSLKTLIISMLLSFFIVKFVKIIVLTWANVCYNRHRR